MNLEKYFEIMHLTEKLKNNTRHSWLSSGRRESVAEHCYRLTLMAYFMKDEFKAVSYTHLTLPTKLEV